MTRLRCAIPLVWMIVVGFTANLAAGQSDQPPAPVEIMPDADLAKIYSYELHKSVEPDTPLFNQLYNANLLLERYFNATSDSQRQQVVKELQGTKVPAATIGRLTRIRMTWPALKPGVYYINERAGSHPVKYFLGIPPDYDRTIPWPLVIKLPVAMPFLAVPPLDAQGVANLYADWMRQEIADHPDAVVVMPLLDLTEFYGPSYAGMNTVIQPMLDVANKVNIDPRRVFMVGHSMAAHAVWNIALHYTTYFSSFLAMAGGADQQWQRLRVKNLRNVLPVVWADTQDNMIPVRESRALVNELRILHYDVDYEETNGLGHIPTQEIYDRLYRQMRARVRDLYPSHVSIQSDRPDTMFNRIDWVQVYQEIETGPEEDLELTHGTGTIALEQNAFTLEATVAGNRVHVDADNVDTMRLYFNDQMVD
ncbi:MAG TPA: hypothetical protein VMD30_10060, partial [Tepidisphaeraceae bacterium]|nr:hypothetical protein [Tepidisphaeraceae bacterium]